MLGFMGSFSNPTASLSEDGLDIYLHGYVSSRIMKLSSTEEGLPVTIAATHFDGLVLALTPNSHSYNYRSAILHGYAIPLTDEEVDEKLCKDPRELKISYVGRSHEHTESVSGIIRYL